MVVINCLWRIDESSLKRSEPLIHEFSLIDFIEISEIEIRAIGIIGGF